MVKVNSSEEINILQKNLAELQTSRMQWNKHSYIAGTPSTRLERLLRERELRKLNRSFPQSEEVRDWNREVDQCLTEIDNWPPEEELLQGFAVGRRLSDGFERQDRQPPKQRLLVVANRLPVSAVRRGEDSWALEISVGGLVSALLGVNEFEARWIGWAGVNVPDEIGQRTLTKALAEKRCIPVFLDEEIVHQYYNGYCNNILWPLFHYLGLPQEDRLATTRSFQSQFDAYKKTNQMFADVVNEHYEDGDIVWCRDYHLMFLPKCLKEYNNKMKVGWFLHTPFPSSEIHRTLPSRLELLRSVLAADLVGYYSDEWLHDDQNGVPPHRDEEVTRERNKCFKRYFEDIMEQTMVIREFGKFSGYVEAFFEYDFIHSRWYMDPYTWWCVYGAYAPTLQKLALRLLV